jgi:magnesium chelatase subunit H
LPGLTLAIHAADEWGSDPQALQRCCDDVARADIIVATMLFMEDHFPAAAGRCSSGAITATP